MRVLVSDVALSFHLPDLSKVFVDSLAFTLDGFRPTN